MNKIITTKAINPSLAEYIEDWFGGKQKMKIQFKNKKKYQYA